MFTICQQEILGAAFKNDLTSLQAILRDPEIKPSAEVLKSLLTPEVHSETFATVLDHGWSPNLRTAQFNRPILSAAAHAGRPDIVQLLLQRGADPNAVDEFGGTALLNCSNRDSSEHVSCLRELLVHGADPSIGRAYSPLTWAADAGAIEQMRILLDIGVDPNEWYRRGNALCVAIDRNKVEVAKVLLDAGADSSLVIPAGADMAYAEYGGISLIDLARKLKRKNIVDLLEGGRTDEPTVETGTIRQLWAAIERELFELGVDVNEVLNPGVDRAEIILTASALQLELPSDVIESWELHDGQPFGAGVFHFDEGTGLDFVDRESSLFRLLPAEEWKEEVDRLRAMRSDVDPTGEAFRADTGVIPTFWADGWLPLARNAEGDLLCSDLVPASRGVVGQVLLLSSESSTRRRIASSWKDCLPKLTVGIEIE